MWEESEQGQIFFRDQSRTRKILFCNCDCAPFKVPKIVFQTVFLGALSCLAKTPSGGTSGGRFGGIQAALSLPGVSAHLPTLYACGSQVSFYLRKCSMAQRKFENHCLKLLQPKKHEIIACSIRFIQGFLSFEIGLIILHQYLHRLSEGHETSRSCLPFE